MTGGALGTSELALVALIGLVSGVVNTLAGAGTLITLPALIFLGLPPAMANATGRVGVALQSASATWTFRRKGALDLGLGLRLLVPAGLGAAAGAWASTAIDPHLFQRLIAVVMLVMLPLVIRGRPTGEPRALPVVAQGPIFFAIGLYGGFIQAGVGLFVLAALRATHGLDLVRANALKSMLVLGFTLVALAVFGVHGLIEPRAALALAVGGALGGALGGHLTLAGGERLIRAALVITVLASAGHLLGLF